ncbi:nucleoside-diphosphate kinase [Ordospora pajunii]|uniref:nucleoside-diphosphate kinase n=1 Tax=Ordospora pajunii TaxID=3039483 RepID=UPI0029528512|nr:nucleoside-diphosphate kinase [Ordospora pajunii]KAH9411177.1 nucleoside-diphosphate kinase [Ordospora pajunii]
MERTFIMIKPDGVKRRLISSVIERFEKKGLYLTACKCMTPSREILTEHYGHLSKKPFFEDMVNGMMSGMVLAMVWSGDNAVSIGRSILGETNPLTAPMGTIRGDYGISIEKNIVHGSDSAENAEKEIKLWIGTDVQAVVPFDKEWIY